MKIHTKAAKLQTQQYRTRNQQIKLEISQKMTIVRLKLEERNLENFPQLV